MKMTKVATLGLKSNAFRHNGTIPTQYTCDGDNMQPPLQLSNRLYAAQSLALVVEDLDVIGTPVTHWLVWNIDPTTQLLGENTLPPDAVEGRNSFDELGYRGPCPDMGMHRYRFTLYALDTKVALPEGSSRKAFDSAVQGHILAEATLVGKYSGRPEINQRKPTSAFR